MTEISAFDIINALGHSKVDILTEENKSVYSPYFINKAFSQHPDTVFHANEMNMRAHIPIDCQYKYFMNMVRPKKRFGKWPKPVKDDNFEIVKKYYNYNNKKTKEAMLLLTAEQIETIKSLVSVDA